MVMKLGKHAPKFHPKTLAFANFLPPALPTPPAKLYLEYKVPPGGIGMYGNDRYGDCVFAMVAHWLMLITAHTGTMVVPTLDDVLRFYAAVTGFDPSTGANDNGAAITDALAYWQTNGFCGHKIDGWASIDPQSVVHQKLALWMFLGVGTGIQCPASAQQQFADGQPFDVVDDDGGIEGGHAILEAGRGDAGEDVQTWGKGDQKATNAFGERYADERYIVLTHDLIEVASNRSPFGFDYDALHQALSDLKG